MTKQRKLIINTLDKSTKEIFTVKELTDKLKNKDISQSAVYRNISFLEQEGLLCRVSNEKNNEILYRYINNKTCNNIIHLVCDNCNNALHLNNEITELISNNAIKEYGFEVNNHTTSIKGTCKSCMNSKNKRRYK